MTPRDLATEGAVPGQQHLTPDDVRNPPCKENCPFVRDCAECRFKSGTYERNDEQTTPRTRRKEARNGSHQDDQAVDVHEYDGQFVAR